MDDPNRSNDDQIAYWNGAAGASWVSGQTRLDAALAPVSAAAIDHAGIRPSEMILDIGCGCGATTLTLAAAVGRGGRVTGLDVSAPMLELARMRGAAIGNVDWVLDDAARHEFVAGSVDVLFSRFGVMFFADPVAAFTNLRRALAPSGRLVFACWRPLDENPWMHLPLKAVSSHVQPPARPGPDDPGPFAFADCARVARILTEAGFVAPAFARFDFSMEFGQGEGLAAATEQAATAGPASRALQDQSETIQAAARFSIAAALAPYLDRGTVKLAASVWLVSATAR